MSRNSQTVGTTKRQILTKRRVIVGGIILFVLFLIWVELAVGLFGSPFAGS